MRATRDRPGHNPGGTVTSVIRQNRAVPILLVLTFAFILYLAGCFGSEEPETAAVEVPTVVVDAPTPAPIVTEEIDGDAPKEEPFFHTVEEGDRLGSIAAKYNVTVDVILRANPDVNPNVIIAGQKLRIPGAGTNNETAQSAGPDRDPGVEVDYVVESGDTFGSIALEYTVSVDALVAANADVDPANLQVNQLLVIPPYGTGLDPAELQALATPVPIEREPGEPLRHVVAAGDFIAAIAERYDVTIAQIVEANNLSDNGNNIQIGQDLLIPTPNEDEP